MLHTRTFGMDAQAHELHRHWKPLGKVHDNHAKAIRGFIKMANLDIGITLLTRGREHKDDRARAVQHLKIAK